MMIPLGDVASPDAGKLSGCSSNDEAAFRFFLILLDCLEVCATFGDDTITTGSLHEYSFKIQNTWHENAFMSCQYAVLSSLMRCLSKDNILLLCHRLIQ